tara:strand:+ start:3241 stop:4209 length:969 start_codon:yes stop_codon:yes gene_type:complete
MITINYLSHNRFNNFWKITSNFLNLIKEENKSKIRVNVLSTNSTDFDRLDGIETNIVVFNPGYNYMSKIEYAVSQETKYSVKLDEDCFVGNHVWDYMIENMDILSSDENLVLSPLVSNNIPLVDQFIESFVTDQIVKDKIYSQFLKRDMPNGLWGVDYSSLNKYTLQASSWDPSSFYEGVAKINHYYKGIHPIRICAEAQIILNDYIIDNFSKITDRQDYSIEEFICPYHTPGVILIKTKDWKNIIMDRGPDAFDEVPYNTYKNRYNKKTFYVKNGFAIHLTYNTIHNCTHNSNYTSLGIAMINGLEYETNLIEKIINKLGC